MKKKNQIKIPFHAKNEYIIRCGQEHRKIIQPFGLVYGSTSIKDLLLSKQEGFLQKAPVLDAKWEISRPIQATFFVAAERISMLD